VTEREIRLSAPLLALALLVGSVQPTVSAAGETRPGPQSGPTSLAVDASGGGLIKVDGSLFRSSDRARTWQPLSLPTGLKPGDLRHVATTAAAPSRVYAAGPGAGVLRSDDQGKTWRTINTGLPSQGVAALAVHTFRPDTIYTWLEGHGVFRTEDGGGSWQKMDDGPPATVVGLGHSTLEGSMNTGWLYAATPEGPYISMD